MLTQETPAGAIDGGNTSFTLTQVPVANSLQLYWNGLLLLENRDYTLSGSSITTTLAPDAGDWLIAFYETTGVTSTGATAFQLGDISQWAATRVLNRTDMLADALQFAKDVYTMVGTRVPFDELSTTSAERAMVSGTATYSLSDLDIAGIVSVRLATASNTYRRLRRSHVRLYDGFSSITNGVPAQYARWGLNIEVHPPPNSSSYTYRIRYWRRPSFTPQIEDTAILLPVEWAELLKWETLYRLYYALEQYDKAASLVMVTPLPRQPETRRRQMLDIGIIPRLWNELLQTTSQRENVDEDFGINPTIRPYTSVRHG